jgi:hypothetical protein
MRRSTAERLARLYPRVWRARFGAEFVDLLEAQALGPRVLLDVLRAALAERLLNLSGLETSAMTAYPTSVLALARRPSGFIPVLMSLTALAIVIASLATMGPVRPTDEGAAAHIFQLLLVGEVPVLVFFVVRWLPRDIRAALTILAIQAAAIGLAIFPVLYFGL